MVSGLGMIYKLNKSVELASQFCIQPVKSDNFSPSTPSKEEQYIYIYIYIYITQIQWIFFQEVSNKDWLVLAVTALSPYGTLNQITCYQQFLFLFSRLLELACWGVLIS